MKKIIASIFLMIAIMVFSACGGAPLQNSSTNSSQPQTTSSQPADNSYDQEEQDAIDRAKRYGLDIDKQELDKLTPEDFTKIRLQIPYEGLEEFYAQNYFIEMDETQKKLTAYLSRLNLWEDEFDSIAQRNPHQNIMVMAMLTQSYGPDVDSSAAVVELLKPITASVSHQLNLGDGMMSEGMFWLKEHMEATAKLLYGPDYVLKHQSSNFKFGWCEKQGVYTPPHTSVDGTQAYALAYQDTGSEYIVEVALIRARENGYYDLDRQIYIKEDSVGEHLITQSIRRQVVVAKGDNGALYLRSCQKMQ